LAVLALGLFAAAPASADEALWALLKNGAAIQS
jgi:hypothetical protein